MSTSTVPADQVITDIVTAWPGVTAAHGSRGEFSFKLGRREIGHLHGDRVAHFGFPPELGARLRSEGRIGPHPAFPHKEAWGARVIDGDEDVEEVVALMRLNYERAIERFGVPA